jgi:hypothetical protein
MADIKHVDTCIHDIHKRGDWHLSACNSGTLSLRRGTYYAVSARGAQYLAYGMRCRMLEYVATYAWWSMKCSSDLGVL